MICCTDRFVIPVSRVSTSSRLNVNIFVRTDASCEIGHGHVMRCLALAQALVDRATVHFICRDEPGNLLDRIASQGCVVHRLRGGGLAGDAEASRDAIEAAGQKADWLIVDHYALDTCWESALRTHADRLMVIDDLADRPHECDVLLDQNLVADKTRRYVGRVPADCILLLGPEYALLQPVYSDLRSRVQPRRRVRKIMIFWGGTDNDDFTSRSLAACLAQQRPDIFIDVVITASYRHADRVRALAAPHPNVRLLSDLPSLAPLMAESDLAIGAAGTTSWERICLGLPAVVSSVADNQHAIAKELNSRGLVTYLGPGAQVTDDDLRRVVAEIVDQDLQAWSERCLAVLDGRGTRRVALELTQRPGRLSVREATTDDESRLLDWANDPLTRQNAFSVGAITPDEHHAWFTKRLAAPDRCRLFIVEDANGDPIGQVRFDRGDDGWVISYGLAPACRGRGLGRPMLDSALRRLRAEAPGARVVGFVKEHNRQSCRVFEALGFVEARSNGVCEYRRTA